MSNFNNNNNLYNSSNTTSQPLSSSLNSSIQHQNQFPQDNNDLSKPSFFKTAATPSSHDTSLLNNSSSNVGPMGAVRDPLSMADIESRGLASNNLGVGNSKTSSEVLTGLKNKENNVLIGAAKEINELQQKENEHRVKMLNEKDSIADIQRRQHENIAAVSREKEEQIAKLKKEEAQKIAEIQRKEHEEINKLKNKPVEHISKEEKKIHDVAVHAKEQLDQVRATEHKVQQNLSAAEQLRSMAHEREVLAEKQNAESLIANSTATSLHGHSTTSSSKTSSSKDQNVNKLDSTHRPVIPSSTTSSTMNQPIVSQTTTQTTTGTGMADNRYTRGA